MSSDEYARWREPPDKFDPEGGGALDGESTQELMESCLSQS